ncbi:hypothetical protein LOAG_14630, partial [Loa loa]
LTLAEIQFGFMRKLFLMSTDFTNDCLVYRKVNGTIKKWDYDECTIGNRCCFSAIIIDQSTNFVVETGGCQNDFQSFIQQHPDIRVHPIDRLPFLGQFSDEKFMEYCE